MEVEVLFDRGSNKLTGTIQGQEIIIAAFQRKYGLNIKPITGSIRETHALDWYSRHIRPVACAFQDYCVRRERGICRQCEPYWCRYWNENR